MKSILKVSLIAHEWPEDCHEGVSFKPLVTDIIRATCGHMKTTTEKKSLAAIDASQMLLNLLIILLFNFNCQYKSFKMVHITFTFISSPLPFPFIFPHIKKKQLKNVKPQ